MIPPKSINPPFDFNLLDEPACRHIDLMRKPREQIGTYLAQRHDQSICDAIAERIGETVEVPKRSDQAAFLARFKDRIRRIKLVGTDYEEWHLDGKVFIAVWEPVIEFDGMKMTAYQKFLRYDKDGNPVT